MVLVIKIKKTILIQINGFNIRKLIYWSIIVLFMFAETISKMSRK
jgi:hypothetical protein